MDVIHIVRQYYPAIGGLENFVKALAEQQVKQGLGVKVVTLDRSYSTNEKFCSTEIVNGVEIVRIGFVGSIRYPIAPKVLKEIKSCDLVHVHCTDFFSDFLSLCRSNFNKPLVLTTHGGFFHTEFAGRIKTLYFNTITRLSLARFSAILASSVNDFERFSSISKNVRLLENGVDVARFIDKPKVASSEYVKFVFVGRLSVNKRVAELIDWFLSISKNQPSWHLCVIGNDYDGIREALAARIEQENAEGKVTLTSGLTNEEVEQELLSSHFICSASSYEGFGMTIIEGMSAGLVPIVSDIPSFEKIVSDSGIGLVTDFTDPAKLNESNHFIKESLESFEYLSSASREFSAKYSWERVERLFFKEYQKALGTREMTIHGIKIKNLNSTEALNHVENLIETASCQSLAFANAHTVNEANSNSDFMEVLKGFSVLPDGVGVDLAAKYKYGHKFKDNLNGTDFVPYLLQNLSSQRVFLIGGREGVAEKVLNIWKREYSQHEWVGAHHGFLSAVDSQSLSNALATQKIDVLIVAMGNPKQEHWIAEYGARCSAKLSIGVGALFDFVAGEAVRAPTFVRRVRLEWLYRLIKEPKRLGKRYILGNPLFILRTLFRG
ncbi:WecB/TagA/CpsF family glycosyltransferase [Alteromonas sp.]|uniref:WecB/TagA/CpsF family glycosyltransferase n=1 Tax=Alteromonas sp. TaxID=232 RepID=UPI00257B9328|nr:WecB/TagA/CpsF family glycosyltransferase [Alteromonas sp.]NQY17641.1 WecB/TagA/CpsF family glycosyltransferase [Alteromonas sp.]